MVRPPITLKVSGSLLDAQGIERLAQAIHRLPEDRSIALVHGGGPQLDEALTKLEEPVRHHEGLRVTSRAQAGVVQATLDRVGSHLVAGLEHHGVQADHVDSFERRLVAKPKHVEDGEVGRVGTPVRLRTDGLACEDRVPVLTPVGTDGTGPLNVNADEAAAALAAALDSPVLVFATSVPGVLDAQGNPLRRLAPAEARALIEQGAAEGGMKPKLEAALQALAGGVARVHVAPLGAGLLAEAIQEGGSPGTCLTSRREALA